MAENYKTEYHLIDEFRGAPNRVNSALREKPRPVRIGGESFVQASAEPDTDKKAAKKAESQSDENSKTDKSDKKKKKK